jgi:hypothetical protein
MIQPVDLVCYGVCHLKTPPKRSFLMASNCCAQWGLTMGTEASAGVAAGHFGADRNFLALRTAFSNLLDASGSVVNL